jgi:hypothetical protein
MYSTKITYWQKENSANTFLTVVAEICLINGTELVETVDMNADTTIKAKTQIDNLLIDCHLFQNQIP